MKTSRLSRRSLLALSLGLLGLAAAHASAQTVITAVPYTITTSGKYTLGGNLTSTSTSEPAIRINAPNVILDLNGHYVAGPGDSSLGLANYYSVILVGEVANAKIRNGTVAGNVYGILYTAANPNNSRNYVVDHVTFSRCYTSGVYCYHAAPGSVVKSCSFSAIGKSTRDVKANPGAVSVKGGFRIENNNVGDVTPTGSGTSYAFSGANSDFMIGNTAANCTVGFAGAKCLNNLTYNVTTPFLNTTNANGNN